MSIEATVVQTIAEVEISDDYQVRLSVLDGAQPLDPDDAAKLADELYEAATRAKEMQLADARAARAVVHGFDVASPPVICRDCVEGKHGACIGSAFVERGPDIDEVDCRCVNPAHNRQIRDGREK